MVKIPGEGVNVTSVPRFGRPSTISGPDDFQRRDHVAVGERDGPRRQYERAETPAWSGCSAGPPTAKRCSMRSLIGMKAELKLTADQEKFWGPFKAAVQTRRNRA